MTAIGMPLNPGKVCLWRKIFSIFHFEDQKDIFFQKYDIRDSLIKSGALILF